eukprot:Em0008g322a
MHHVVVGFNSVLTWLKKRLAALGLKRRNVVETRLTLVHQAIKNELQTSNCCLGYRAMWRLLQLKYRYTIKRSTVMMLLAVMDPIASRLRKVKRLTRRTYVNKASDKPHVCSYLYLELSVSFQGPNWCWHINGYVKLKPFGFPIHACIDGFSQKIIWLELTATNNDPDVVVKFYLDAVVKLEAISTLPGIRGSSWTFEVHSMPPTWRRHATLYLHSPAKSTDLNGLMYKCKACFHNVAPFKSQRSEPFLEPCHYAVTCKHGGDVVTRHNRLHDCIVEVCRRAHIGVRVEVGNNLTPSHSKTCSADIPNWVVGRTATLDVSVTSPLNPQTLLEAGVTALEKT